MTSTEQPASGIKIQPHASASKVAAAQKVALSSAPHVGTMYAPLPTLCSPSQSGSALASQSCRLAVASTRLTPETVHHPAHARSLQTLMGSTQPFARSEAHLCGTCTGLPCPLWCYHTSRLPGPPGTDNSRIRHTKLSLATARHRRLGLARAGTPPHRLHPSSPPRSQVCSQSTFFRSRRRKGEQLQGHARAPSLHRNLGNFRSSRRGACTPPRAFGRFGARARAPTRPRTNQVAQKVASAAVEHHSTDGGQSCTVSHKLPISGQ